MKTRKAQDAYLQAYSRAMQALADVQAMIHDMPAPDGEVKIDWSHVGDMTRIAGELQSMLPEA